MEGARWAFRCGSWTPSRREWLFAARCVQREEKERIGRFVFAKDAKAAMAGRLLIRKLLCEKMGVTWDEIHLERTAKGKPFLASPAPLSPSDRWSFNISHQGDFAVLAAECGLQVGVDVMKTRQPGRSSVPDFFRIMKRQFTDHEWAVIKGAGSEWMQLDMFHRHWALKESFIKAIGIGVGFDLRRVEFHVSPVHMQQGQVYRETRMCVDSKQEDTSWVFEESLLDQDHHVAVALGKVEEMNRDGLQEGDNSWISRIPPPQQFKVLCFSDLISGAIPIEDEDTDYWEDFQKKKEDPGS
ncbi:L-aminoadipate-semialdehyde dehydrogenase-phosphopantetheinyl transferase-like [Scleropages formosus]|uniref:L-aminoadipate-semialdehyde dehydrogenase-phosphopantetheinyl transferase n=1 Tax=Scleropages formosus TaxID=113540 RepID=A0A0P7UW08_SCLFO|nr:L-aminoadipate-semialdehyde dehydrogenase-phosphopantetheinyl transferase [Scleropages formosus]XP_018586517.1 L-aminoadipate-semialdehyde dehydrogenase-phosphopantetheinyl transferase [Scleropages formosus]KPP74221.1 L-aminoadipate-semialdehyde dehydrogenase-phosphopantetheinyl transferase-like [Scleropages formosus]